MLDCSDAHGTLRRRISDEKSTQYGGFDYLSLYWVRPVTVVVRTLLQGEVRLAVHSDVSLADSDLDVCHFAEKGLIKVALM